MNAEKGQYNLLFIYTDEQAVNTLACYGNSQIQMPNLNRLAQCSVVLDQAYVTQPVCTPSRSSLLTGLYPHTNGCTQNNVPLSPQTPCLPEMLAGEYATGHFGKWHLGDEIFPQHGFQEWRGIEDDYANWYTHDHDALSDYQKFLFENGLTPPDGKRYFDRNAAARLPEEYSKPAFLAREASDFLKRHRRDPFVLYVNFLEPHMPFFGPRDDQYDPADIPLPETFEAPPASDQPLKTRVMREAYYTNGHSGLPLQTPEQWQRLKANYWGLCSLVDTHVGCILDTLDELELTDKTIIVFTSDHGDMMGAHQLLAKCVMFEPAVRVPCLIHLPGQQRNTRLLGPTSQIDLVPTLLDLMGESIPETLQGKSLTGYLNPAADTCIRQDVVIEWQGPNSGIPGDGSDSPPVPESLKNQQTSEQLFEAITDPVRSLISADGWKYNASPLGEDELYNLNNDPGERHNLINEAAQAGRIAELQARLAAWREKTDDLATN